jgi:transmembrane sensor
LVLLSGIGVREAIVTHGEGSDQAAIQQQAREWLIRMDADASLSAEETAALCEWVARSPAHRAELQRIAVFWRGANILTELAVPLQRQRAAVSPANRWMPLGFGVRSLTAAAMVCAAIAVTAWWYKPSVALNGIYTTAIGQQHTLSLADGSTVQINTDSQVQVDYEEHLRKIRLLRGEAFFTVAPSARRPFEVFAASGVVKAVGTAFAVSLQGPDIRVTVAKGQVDVGRSDTDVVSTGGAHARDLVPAHPLASLKAGQTAIFGHALAIETHEISAPELTRRLSWHEGYLVYSGQPLDEVVSEVNRYSAVTLEIVDPGLRTLAIGGRFKVGDLEAICDVLQSNFGIRIVRIDDRHIQLRLAQSH